MKWVLVTGGSSGIGFELAKQFAQDGYGVVLAARHRKELQEAENKLQAQYAVPTRIVVSDLSKRDGPRKLYRELKRKKIRLDVRRQTRTA